MWSFVAALDKGDQDSAAHSKERKQPGRAQGQMSCQGVNSPQGDAALSNATPLCSCCPSTKGMHHPGSCARELGDSWSGEP